MTKEMGEGRREWRKEKEGRGREWRTERKRERRRRERERELGQCHYKEFSLFSRDCLSKIQTTQTMHCSTLLFRIYSSGFRQELKDKYSSQAKEKVDADYKRTQQDFYRMELDRIDQVSPKIRPQLISTYMAYLQNTPGSRRAIHDCVRNLKVEEKANWNCMLPDPRRRLDMVYLGF